MPPLMPCFLDLVGTVDIMVDITVLPTMEDITDMDMDTDITNVRPKLNPKLSSLDIPGTDTMVTDLMAEDTITKFWKLRQIKLPFSKISSNLAQLQNSRPS